MGQPRSQMIASAVQENRRLIFKPAKRARVNDPGAVALKLGPIAMALLGIFSAARVSRFLREGREDSALSRFHFLARFPTVLHHRVICWMSIVPHPIFRATRAPFAALVIAAPAHRRARATAR